MIPRTLTAILLLSAASPIAAAESLRCRTELITPGDTSFELLAACGEPDHKHRRTTVRTRDRLGPGVVESAHVYQEIETWTYAAAGGRMMRLVEIRQGQVTAIRSIAVRDQGGDRCARAIFGQPTLIGQVELACGAPDDRSQWVEERVLRDKHGRERIQLVTHERWIIAPGPGMLLRIFEFENGKLVRESTGARAGEG
jgi:hypothetical protein